MEIRKPGLSRVQLLVLMSIFLLSLFFAFSSLTVSSCIESRVGCESSVLPLSMKVYIDTDANIERQLAKEYSANVGSLEFMTWDKERTKLARYLLSIQRKQINLNPINARYWLELNSLNKTAKANSQERIWSVEKSIRVAGWRDEYRSSLIFYCVIDAQSLSKNNSKLCRDVLLELPKTWTIEQAARKANVGVDVLKSAIDHLQPIAYEEKGNG